ncbi:MAG: hypothetical protein JWN70_729 [Planctomycetaceae bacterium]|nr:hypothetical protein [Planctomycetaceae bacterium]
MAVNTAQVSGRRKLHFADFSQLLADVDYVATHPCHTLGNWSVGQILDHLAVAANAPFDGFGGFKASWFTRNLIVPFVKNNLLTKPMKAGFQMPKEATAMFPSADVTPQVGYSRLKQALARFSSELPKFPHPVLGDLAFQEWVAVTLRHAELHLSFIIPEEIPVPL